jgi:hypothetical protein
MVDDVTTEEICGLICALDASILKEIADFVLNKSTVCWRYAQEAIIN